jgi:hypothetical protein
MLIEINVDSKAQLIQRKNPGEIVCGWFFRPDFHRPAAVVRDNDPYHKPTAILFAILMTLYYRRVKASLQRQPLDG